MSIPVTYKIMPVVIIIICHSTLCKSQIFCNLELTLDWTTQILFSIYDLEAENNRSPKEVLQEQFIACNPFSNHKQCNPNTKI